MQTQNSISPVSPAFFLSDSMQFNQNRETFHDVFQRTLNSKSGARPPKIELTGTLVPCDKVVHGYQCRFKLESDSSEYVLRLNDPTTLMAKKMEWEEVTVKGFFDPDNRLFEVETISLAQRSEPFRPAPGPLEPSLDLDPYGRFIERRSKLDLARGYLAP